ncbi:BTAD domain-containing putative transcriptional regulator [Nocardia sp. NPDC056100]|uniref:AfsR/SARP family transcriptional regulator n=1 Tax=Nocardia sp. NPDC056100 TaxID=3345712 RepID=UPI0035E3AC06
MGDFEIGFEGSDSIRWRSKKCTSLFAFLLINHGQPISRERLERALWPRSEKPAGPTSLKVAVHTLRRVLDENFGSARDFLHVDSADGCYRLRLGEQVRVDIHEFERLCREGSEASWQAATAATVDHYGQAVDVYRGDLLAGYGEEWVLEQREWLRSKMMHALDVLVRYAGDIDDGPTTVRLARRMLELDPAEERAFRAMILMHGRRAELDQVNYWYDLCVGRLARDLDVSPHEETQRLLQHARNGDLANRNAGRARSPRKRGPRRGAARREIGERLL